VSGNRGRVAVFAAAVTVMVPGVVAAGGIDTPIGATGLVVARRVPTVAVGAPPVPHRSPVNRWKGRWS